MPKMKTHSGAKKRFKLTARGKVRARHAMRSHILGKKNAKRKRQFSSRFTIREPELERRFPFFGHVEQLIENVAALRTGW